MPKNTESRTYERLLIGSVAAIGIVTMIFGFFGLRKSIFGPFIRTGLSTYKTPEQRHQEALVALKTKDTDRDSVSDYDELYLFRTNPYLEDTDSDGIPDGTEIAGNSDPNCPAGKTCRAPRVASSGTDGTGSGVAVGGTDIENDASQGAVGGSGGQGEELSEEQMMQSFVDVFGDPTKITSADAMKTVEGMSSAQLRDFFIKMGVPQDAVDKADDESLRQLMKEAMQDIKFGSDLTSEAGGDSPGN